MYAMSHSNVWGDGSFEICVMEYRGWVSAMKAFFGMKLDRMEILEEKRYLYFSRCSQWAKEDKESVSNRVSGKGAMENKRREDRTTWKERKRMEMIIKTTTARKNSTWKLVYKYVIGDIKHLRPQQDNDIRPSLCRKSSCFLCFSVSLPLPLFRFIFVPFVQRNVCDNEKLCIK